MKFFEKSVDLRSRAAMTAFLQNHARYWTMRSNNRSSSYAHCVKLPRLGLTSAQLEAAYEMLEVDYWDEIDDPIQAFTARQGGHYTIGSNGRSGGYLVLYPSRYETSEHKSFCRTCGQRNFKAVAQLPEDPALAAIATEVIKSGGSWLDAVYLDQAAIRTIATLSDDEKLAAVARFKRQYHGATLDNRCGRCGAEGERGRRNFDTPPRHLQVLTKGLDDGGEIDTLSMDELRARVRLVQDFDRTCDAIRDNFIDLLSSCHVEEETILVPKTVKRIACGASA